MFNISQCRASRFLKKKIYRSKNVRSPFSEFFDTTFDLLKYTEHHNTHTVQRSRYLSGKTKLYSNTESMGFFFFFTNEYKFLHSSLYTNVFFHGFFFSSFCFIDVFVPLYLSAYVLWNLKCSLLLSFFRRRYIHTYIHRN